MSSIADSLHSNSLCSQLGLGNDTSGDLGYGLNLSRLCNSTNGGNSVQTSTSGILGGSGSSNNADSQSNAEIFQRLSQMLENSAELNSLTGESTSKRNYQGKI